jgi:hypothetical protein
MSFMCAGVLSLERNTQIVGLFAECYQEECEDGKNTKDLSH